MGSRRCGWKLVALGMIVQFAISAFGYDMEWDDNDRRYIAQRRHALGES